VGIGRREGAVDNPAVFTIGMGGYIGGRSLEKVAAAISGPASARNSR
jgi:hypothetical protein